MCEEYIGNQKTAHSFRKRNGFEDIKYRDETIEMISRVNSLLKGTYDKDKAGITESLADIMISCYAIAESLNIEIDTEVAHKIYGIGNREEDRVMENLDGFKYYDNGDSDRCSCLFNNVCDDVTDDTGEYLEYIDDDDLDDEDDYGYDGFEFYDDDLEEPSDTKNDAFDDFGDFKVNFEDVKFEDLDDAQVGIENLGTGSEFGDVSEILNKASSEGTEGDI